MQYAQVEYAQPSLAQARVLNASGEEIELASLWQAHPVILVFLRHFACIACRAHAQNIWARRHLYEHNGSKIVFIGNGTANHITAFRQNMNLNGAPIFTDPHLHAFRAAGFKRSFMRTFSGTSILNFVRLSLEGHRQKMHSPGHGDLLQLGGVLLVMQDGHVRYKYTSTAVGDFPPESDLEYIAKANTLPFSLESCGPIGLGADFSRR